MIPRMSTWARVNTGTHIRSKDGVAWKVMVQNDRAYGLVDRDGNEKLLLKEHVPDDAPVEIYFLTQDELEAQIREQLGGTVQNIKRAEDSIFISREFATLHTAEKISHIKLMHRVWVGDAGAKTPKQLTECHDQLHLETSEKWVPHIHADRLNRPSPFDDYPEV